MPRNRHVQKGAIDNILTGALVFIVGGLVLSIAVGGYYGMMVAGTGFLEAETTVAEFVSSSVGAYLLAGFCIILASVLNILGELIHEAEWKMKSR